MYDVLEDTIWIYGVYDFGDLVATYTEQADAETHVQLIKDHLDKSWHAGIEIYPILTHTKFKQENVRIDALINLGAR